MSKVIFTRTLTSCNSHVFEKHVFHLNWCIIVRKQLEFLTILHRIFEFYKKWKKNIFRIIVPSECCSCSALKLANFLFSFSCFLVFDLLSKAGTKNRIAIKFGIESGLIMRPASLWLALKFNSTLMIKIMISRRILSFN